MSYYLFFLYCLFFCSLITNLKFFTDSRLSKRILLSLFLIRIVVLIIACYVNVYILPVSDSLAFHQMGIEEFNLLFQNPHEYFVNIFQIGYAHGHGRLLDDTHSFWNNLRTNLMAKMLSIFDLFSLKSFLINTLFYNFLIFFGCVALYKVFIKMFPKCFYQVIICIFLLPSALFFSSEIHRDGLILLSMAMVIYHLFFILYENQFSWRRIFIITLFLSLIFLLRNFVFLAFLPALISWVVAKKFPKFAFVSFLAIYVFSTILFFCSSFISPRTNLPQYVSLRQQSFVKIGAAGTSTINIKPLYPNFKSFLFNAPEALNHSLLRPYLWKIKNVEYLPFALEIFLIEILILLLIFYHKKGIHIDPLIYCCIFFSLSMLLITGYTVPIIGAIVRYRSIYFVLLLIPITCYINWKKIFAQDKKE